MQSQWMKRAEAKRKRCIKNLANVSPHAALNALNEIEKQIALIEDNPWIGTPDRKRSNHFCWPFQRTKYIVFYRIRPRLKRIEFYLFIHHKEDH